MVLSIWKPYDSSIFLNVCKNRGAEELFCLRYLTSLARQAPKQGGKVILLHGNHEALNANGLFQYADRNGNQEIEVVLGKALDAKRSEGTERWVSS